MLNTDTDNIFTLPDVRRHIDGKARITEGMLSKVMTVDKDFCMFVNSFEEDFGRLGRLFRSQYKMLRYQAVPPGR